MAERETPGSCVILFVKYPAPGFVKTRLSNDLGARNSAGLYRNFVEDILKSLKRLRLPVLIFFSPSDKAVLFRKWLGVRRFFHPQRGNDLGERMSNAFKAVFEKGYDAAVLLGSDVPDLPVSIVRRSIEGLKKNDAVLGPAPDGGYYLIGLTRRGFSGKLFKTIRWSTPEVFVKTRAALKKLRRRLLLLPEWDDIDTVYDLTRFWLRNAGKKSASIDFLSRIKFAKTLMTR
ncbi:MAG TPA: TIGR04282 family arsenosugar biosynthesis glycosyltransferase [bacterium]|nr:TIGR04282 family arsenosugar biosynthesis glycosyltransferase [bacterium]